MLKSTIHSYSTNPNEWPNRHCRWQAFMNDPKSPELLSLGDPSMPNTRRRDHSEMLPLSDSLSLYDYCKRLSKSNINSLKDHT